MLEAFGKKAAVIGIAILVSILLLVSAVGSVASQMSAVLVGGGEEEGTEGNRVITLSLNLSADVEKYREQVLEEVKKYGMEAYINLFLAVIMQESGGQGGDIFQASESLGLPPNTLDTARSIEQGVKYLSSMITKAGVTSPEDIEHIRLALQGYNFGGGYIDYAVQKDGKWTQENTFAFAKKKSGGVRNTGSRVEQLGPWHYGDQYYTAHVLRYYQYSDPQGENAAEGENAGVAAGVAVEKRLAWLFPDGTPTSPNGMQKYLTQITVPIINKNGKAATMTLTVHKKLAGEIKKVFEDMKRAGFKIKPEETAGYNWRTMASNSSSISHHSYGCVVDVNWTSNGASYTSWGYHPGKDEFSVTEKIVSIWKCHGFYWGGDWSTAYFDPMHFTYTNH